MKFGITVGGIDVFLPVSSFPHMGAIAEAILPHSLRTATLVSSPWVDLAAVDTE